MAEGDEGLFRQKTIDRMSSPDELTDYLKVTNPGVWVVLIAVVILLVGIIAWSCVGTLPTKASAKVIVENANATVSVAGPHVIDEGMKLTVDGHEYAIESTATSEYGNVVGHVGVDLPDGTYDGSVVVDETRAIDFLLQSDESSPR